MYDRSIWPQRKSRHHHWERDSDFAERLEQQQQGNNCPTHAYIFPTSVYVCVCVCARNSLVYLFIYYYVFLFFFPNNVCFPVFPVVCVPGFNAIISIRRRSCRRYYYYLVLFRVRCSSVGFVRVLVIITLLSFLIIFRFVCVLIIIIWWSFRRIIFRYL